MDHSLQTRNANSRADLEAFWMPFTANKAFKSEPLFIEAAEGNHYTLSGGRRVLDASAGLWCVNAGHGRTRITEAIQRQADRLDYVSTFGHGHELAFQFASRLAMLAPGDLNHVFFTNSGSEAVDTALKIALAYHLANGQGERTRLVGRQMSYHGVGFGGLSVAGLGANRQQFGPLLPGVSHLPHTLDLKRNRFAKGMPEYGVELADRLEDIAAANGASTIAAAIVEPVSGAGGVLPPPVGYLKRLRSICDKHGILLIFDEVITAFGRLGRTFASEHFDVVPDIITCAKGMTNAAVPMGGVLVSARIHDTVMAATEAGPELFHGYTYSGHPLACAAGLATLDYHEEEKLNARAVTLAAVLERELHGLADRPFVDDIRNIGVLGAITLAPRDGAPGARGRALKDACLEMGALIRVSGDLVLISPPLTFETAEMVELVRIVGSGLDQLS